MTTAIAYPRVLRSAVALALAGLAPSLASAAESLALEEVVVTATKQASTIDSTPAAISAVTAERLGPGGIQDIRDLAVSVPNLSVGDQFGVNRTFIRGVGMTSIDLGADGAVAFLQDGAMIARPSAQLGSFFDLEQVEVLRGPQGTLYGRGATAGVVNMVTKKPSEELEGYARLTAGNYSAYTVEAAVGGPISGDKVMGRIALKIDERDGYGQNKFTGSEIDDRDAYAVRGSMHWQPSDAVGVTLLGEYFDEEDNNYAFHYFGTTVVPEDQLAHNLLGGRTIFDYYADRGRKADLRNIYSDEEPINDRNGLAFSLLMDWQMNDAWALKSVTAWRDFERFTRDDLDVSDVWMFGQNNYIEESETLSQEFTLSGNAAGIDWLMGAMYFTEELHGEVKVPLINLGLVFGLPADFFDEGNYWQNGDVDTDAYGLFVEGRYAFNEQWSVTAGARYNYEKRDGTGFFVFDALGVNVPTDKSESWDAVTPKLLVEYDAGGGMLLYGQVTRGFKSGVINVGSLNDVIDPEYVWAYELGLKTGLADGRASLRTAAFYYDYTDLQVGFVNEQSVVETVNAASATNVGIEVELVARLTDSLSGELSATWLDATYDEFVTGDYRNDFEQVDLSGNNLQNAPEYTAFAALDYRRPVTERGSVIGRVEWAWQDDVYFTEFNNEDAFQEAYSVLNANLGYEGAEGRWSAVAWGRNLTDEFVISNNIITAPLYGSIRVGSLLPPRTYGVTFSYNF
jgi:iron complex outermembrane receptor protein